MAALLLTEVATDSRMRKQSLHVYLATLDRQKALDVVDQTILLNKLYGEGINHKLGLLLKNSLVVLLQKLSGKMT